MSNKNTMKRVEEEKKLSKAMIRRCKDVLAPLMEAWGVHCRVIIYPGKPDKKTDT